MKIARFAIFLTGMMGLATGGIMTLSHLQNQQGDEVAKTNEVLKSEAQIYLDQFYGVIESVKGNAHPTSLPYVINQGSVKVNQNALGEFEAFQKANVDPTADFALEERMMKALKSQLSLSELQIAKMEAGTFELSDIGNREGIYVAFPVFKQNTANDIEKVSITLIDPVKAFAGLSKSGTENHSAYFVSKSGKVLAHSIDAFNGTDLTRVQGLKDTIQNLFVGAQVGAVKQYLAIDGNKQQVAFVRAGVFPFAVGVEQKMNPALLSSGWFSDQFHSGATRKSVGMGLVLLAVALIFFSGMSFWLTRELKKQIQENSTARSNPTDFIDTSLPRFALKAQPPSKSPEKQGDGKSDIKSKLKMPLNVDKAAADFVENKAQLNQEQAAASESKARALTVNRDYAREFIDRVRGSFTLEAVEKELVQTASELTESPILYFRYDRKNQNLALASVAGDVQIPNYVNLQAYVRKDIEQQVEGLATSGKVASITNYGPIAKLMIANLNTAHFEAWAVTSDPEVSGRATFVGAVVVLQAGFRSSQTRPVLAKILREGGSYLFAQSSKIKIRNPHAQTAQAGSNGPRPSAQGVEIASR